MLRPGSPRRAAGRGGAGVCRGLGDVELQQGHLWEVPLRRAAAPSGTVKVGGTGEKCPEFSLFPPSDFLLVPPLNPTEKSEGSRTNQSTGFAEGGERS